MTVKTFIDRPLLSIVISVFIVALGVIALTSLPVEKYPDIAPPAINVWASYPGASAETDTVPKSVSESCLANFSIQVLFPQILTRREPGHLLEKTGEMMRKIEAKKP